MTDTVKEAFTKYEIRKTKKQKEEFRAFVKEYAKSKGYSCKTENAGKANNIVVGNPSAAKVLYTAHYDTPAGVPFPNLITPKCITLYVLYQILLCIALYTIPFIMICYLPDLIAEHTDSVFWPVFTLLAGYALLILECYLLVAGPANKHNANDNTSGVAVLLSLMDAMPEEKRGEVAFIFFDLEEMGLLGSQGYKKQHKNEVKTVPVINFDCVGDGGTILFALSKRARYLEEKLASAFKDDRNFKVDIASKGVFYPSDQKSFNVGIGVAALNTSKHGILYTDKIHTKRDTVCNEANVDYLVGGAVRLTEIL